MSQFILATDLDGTLIPLQGCQQNQHDLIELSRLLTKHARKLIFATGRHFESVVEVIESASLPRPEWIICDVGTAIYQQEHTQYTPYAPYAHTLTTITQEFSRTHVETLLADASGLSLQPRENQRPFKISYYCVKENVHELENEINGRLQAAELPYQCLGSVDPFADRGLLDILPANVDKAYALIWLSKHVGYHTENMVYAGDSGNDFAALTAGFKSIIVANASASLVDKVQEKLGANRTRTHLYCAQATATSGVLAGCKHFGLFDYEPCTESMQ